MALHDDAQMPSGRVGPRVSPGGGGGALFLFLRVTVTANNTTTIAMIPTSPIKPPGNFSPNWLSHISCDVATVSVVVDATVQISVYKLGVDVVYSDCEVV